ncbi:unnamed protein product [Camellia sinensis]
MSSTNYTTIHKYSAPPSLNSDDPIRTQPDEEVPWSTGLFGCFDDVPNCCKTCWCPCITFGQIAEIVDEGKTSCGASGVIYGIIQIVTGWACCYSCTYRSKMRKQYKLRESPCADFFVHCCFESCSLCQESRELTNRGFDLAKGWKGNMEREAPLFGVGMSR